MHTETEKQLKRIADQLEWHNQLLYLITANYKVKSSIWEKVREGIGLPKRRDDVIYDLVNPSELHTLNNIKEGGNNE